MSQQIARRYFEAIATRDVNKIALTFHPDIVSIDPLAGTIRGKDAVVAQFKSLYEQMPDALFEPKSVSQDGRATEWMWTASLPVGRLEIAGVDIMEFADGKIRQIRFYYDPSPLKELAASAA